MSCTLFPTCLVDKNEFRGTEQHLRIAAPDSGLILDFRFSGRFPLVAGPVHACHHAHAHVCIGGRIGISRGFAVRWSFRIRGRRSIRARGFRRSLIRFVFWLVLGFVFVFFVLFRRLGMPQSYSEPETLYRKLHAAGMTFKTITDHNRIAADGPSAGTSEEAGAGIN